MGEERGWQRVGGGPGEVAREEGLQRHRRRGRPPQQDVVAHAVPELRLAHHGVVLVLVVLLLVLAQPVVVPGAEGRVRRAAAALAVHVVVGGGHRSGGGDGGGGGGGGAAAAGDEGGGLGLAGQQPAPGLPTQRGHHLRVAVGVRALPVPASSSRHQQAGGGVGSGGRVAQVVAGAVGGGGGRGGGGSSGGGGGGGRGGGGGAEGQGPRAGVLERGRGPVGAGPLRKGVLLLDGARGRGRAAARGV